MPKKLILPKTVAELLNPQRMADLVEAEKRLNALSNLKVQIKRDTFLSASTPNGSIQFNDDSAMLIITLNF
jgi:hypothetical protein